MDKYFFSESVAVQTITTIMRMGQFAAPIIFILGILRLFSDNDTIRTIMIKLQRRHEHYEFSSSFWSWSLMLTCDQNAFR